MRYFVTLMLLAASLLAGHVQNEFWASIKNNGGYTVQVEKDGEWLDVSDVKFTVNYKTVEIPLPVVNTENLHVRLLAMNDNLAHIDALAVNGKLATDMPGKTKAEQTMMANSDYDVANVEGSLEAVFSNVGDNPVLYLRARVDPDEFFGVPVAVPEVNLGKQPNELEAFSTYTLDSNTGSLKIDGELNDENLGEPFFSYFTKPCTGHPSGITYGWVKNDDKNLYVAVDFTPDNTYDGDADFVSVHIKGENGVKTFRSSVPEQAYGMPGFTYTDKVPYKHKTYEFEIPLAELDSKTELDMAFELYGTVAIPPYTNSSGAVLDDMLLYGAEPNPVTFPLESAAPRWPGVFRDIGPMGGSSVTLQNAGPATINLPASQFCTIGWDNPGDSPLPAALTPYSTSFDLSSIASINVAVSSVTAPPPIVYLTLMNSVGTSDAPPAIPVVAPSTQFDITSLNPAVLSDVAAIEIIYMDGGTGSTIVTDLVTNGADVPLPVSLTSFLAEPIENSIKLVWQTESELENEGFYIERQTLGQEEIFTRISDLIPGQGNSSTAKEYTFLDSQVETDQSYLYQLVTVDSKGKEHIADKIVAHTIVELPETVQMAQNYPNPFNPETTIEYSLPEAMDVTVQIYNTNGRLVRTLVNNVNQPGTHNVVWNGLDDAGQQVSSGVYICRLTTGESVKMMRMQLLR